VSRFEVNRPSQVAAAADVSAWWAKTVAETSTATAGDTALQGLEKDRERIGQTYEMAEEDVWEWEMAQMFDQCCEVQEDDDSTDADFATRAPTKELTRPNTASSSCRPTSASTGCAGTAASSRRPASASTWRPGTASSCRPSSGHSAHRILSFDDGDGTEELPPSLERRPARPWSGRYNANGVGTSSRQPFHTTDRKRPASAPNAVFPPRRRSIPEGPDKELFAKTDTDGNLWLYGEMVEAVEDDSEGCWSVNLAREATNANADSHMRAKRAGAALSPCDEQTSPGRVDDEDVEDGLSSLALGRLGLHRLMDSQQSAGSQKSAGSQPSWKHMDSKKNNAAKREEQLEFQRQLPEEVKRNIAYLRPVAKFSRAKVDRWFEAVDRKKRGLVTRYELWRLLQEKERVKHAATCPAESVDARLEHSFNNNHAFVTRTLREAFATLDEIAAQSGRALVRNVFEIMDKQMAMLYFEAHDLIAPQDVQFAGQVVHTRSGGRQMICRGQNTLRQVFEDRPSGRTVSKTLGSAVGRRT
jgi:hypothetical protein